MQWMVMSETFHNHDLVCILQLRCNTYVTYWFLLELYLSFFFRQ